MNNETAVMIIIVNARGLMNTPIRLPIMPIGKSTTTFVPTLARIATAISLAPRREDSLTSPVS